jgi:hypothetical protein
MIKFSAKTNDGKTLITFGLSDGNLQELRKNKPILVDLAQLGVPGVQIMLMWEETEQAMIDELKAAGFTWPEDE